MSTCKLDHCIVYYEHTYIHSVLRIVYITGYMSHACRSYLHLSRYSNRIVRYTYGLCYRSKLTHGIACAYAQLFVIQTLLKPH